MTSAPTTHSTAPVTRGPGGRTGGPVARLLPFVLLVVAGACICGLVLWPSLLVGVVGMAAVLAAVLIPVPDGSSTT